ncbi:tagaturonate reductase [Pedobacter frigoris]|uniref:Tagaturonate reductase n=1 Tax=Pedobacter frigoris TaxID=2571272 RepID=A0A4U1CRQ7_9SPHI|nr:tagaturonate reductase [Pedobacter frigoris]TKC09575.1 tagaturonate reductase [Pedobacter frigoris]
MIISKLFLKNIKNENVIISNNQVFDLPEKVLQFGTGVLLRGLTDYFIDKGNRQGLFNGRVAVVKSTSKGSTSDFDEQDNLYTICVRGIQNGKNIEENIISSAISRVLVADTDWNEILEIGKNPEVKLIVSNTTEVGIQLVKESIQNQTPASFPAKLLAVLYARYRSLGDTADADIVIIATELIPDNGTKLHSIVQELATYNELETEFKDWLATHALFCNSLVDRIVPGRPEGQALAKLEDELGYQDNLLLVAEPYRLWAIEGNERVARLINVEATDPGVIIKSDIEIYRELKVRLLNGTHTLSCGIAHLAGIDTVAKGMSDTAVRAYVTKVMHDEIAPAIPYNIPDGEATAFANEVLDRFANPYMEHLWINITFQYTMKVKIRILPVLFQYYKQHNKVPKHIAFGFAAFLVFMRTAEKSGDQYYGNYKGDMYPINDDQAVYFSEKSKVEDNQYVSTVLSDKLLWDADLTSIDHFIETVEEYYNGILKYDIKQALLRI